MNCIYCIYAWEKTFIVNMTVETHPHIKQSEWQSTKWIQLLQCSKLKVQKKISIYVIKCCYLCNPPGNIQTVPIGYISSCFAVKNGTPRQPTICGPSRAELRIQQSIFNNPEHALVGLEQYSHVWQVSYIVFTVCYH